MSSKDHIKQLIVCYTRRLQKLEQRVLHNLATILMIFIEVAQYKFVA